MLSRRFSFTMAAARTLTVLLPGTALVLTLTSPPAAIAAVPDAVTGTVVGPEGKAIPGARVSVTAYKDPGIFTPSGTATTDKSGGFRIDLEPLPLPAEEAKKQGFKFYGIATVTAPGFGTVQKLLTSRPNSNVFKLDKAATVTGLVVDQKNRPVVGTTIILRGWVPVPLPAASGDGVYDQDHLMPLPGIPDSLLRATTGADGKWTMGGLPGGGTASFDVSGSGLAAVAPTYREVALAAGKTVTLATIKTQPASTVTGRVIYEGSGKPAGGVQVEILPVKGGISGSATTGNDGTYKMEGLGSGTHYLTFTARDENWVASPQYGVELTEGKPTEIKEVTLIR